MEILDFGMYVNEAWALVRMSFEVRVSKPRHIATCTLTGLLLSYFSSSLAAIM